MYKLILNTTKKCYNSLIPLKQTLLPRVYFCQSVEQVTEDLIRTKLTQRFPQAKSISVEDTSGGCGAMFSVAVETTEFNGLSVMKQHRIVYDVLKEQLKNIHGLHLETRVPK